MGDHVNTRWQNVMNWSIVAIVIVMSTLLGVGTLFPDLFR
jgi:Mn2+/Fe2+ NRAMP family transporter